MVLNYTDLPPPPHTTPPLSDQAIAQTLYLLEHFGVSDEFYHELTILYPSLSR